MQVFELGNALQGCDESPGVIESGVALSAVVLRVKGQFKLFGELLCGRAPVAAGVPEGSPGDTGLQRCTIGARQFLWQISIGVSQRQPTVAARPVDRAGSSNRSIGGDICGAVLADRRDLLPISPAMEYVLFEKAQGDRIGLIPRLGCQAPLIDDSLLSDRSSKGSKSFESPFGGEGIIEFVVASQFARFHERPGHELGSPYRLLHDGWRCRSSVR